MRTRHVLLHFLSIKQQAIQIMPSVSKLTWIRTILGPLLLLFYSTTAMTSESSSQKKLIQVTVYSDLA